MDYEIVAEFIFANIDIIAFEVLLGSIFKIDNKKNVKLTFGKQVNDTKFKKSIYFVYLYIILGIGLFYISNNIQDDVILSLSVLGWKTIPLLSITVSFTIFYSLKIILGRKWDFEIIQASIVVIFVCILLLLFF